MAQRSGFEPEVALTTHAFQACTLDRSDTSANDFVILTYKKIFCNKKTFLFMEYFKFSA